MTKEQQIRALVFDLRQVLDGKRTVTLFGAAAVDTSGMVIEQAIIYAQKAANEAEAAVREAGGSVMEARDAGAEAFINALPNIERINNVRAYIACVAHGVKRSYIPAVQARLLLYTAQLQLAAMTRRVQ